jgi:hypothetical protein
LAPRIWWEEPRRPESDTSCNANTALIGTEGALLPTAGVATASDASAGENDSPDSDAALFRRFAEAARAGPTEGIRISCYLNAVLPLTVWTKQG